MDNTWSNLIKEHCLGNGEEVLVFELKKKWSCSQHRSPRFDKWGTECGREDCPHHEYTILEEGCAECRISDWVPVEPLVLKARLTSGLAWQLEQESIVLKRLLKEDANRTSYG